MSYTHRPSNGATIAGAALLAIAAATGLFFWLAPYWSTQLWWLARITTFWAVPLLVLLVVAAIALYVTEAHGGPIAIALWLLVAAGIVAYVPWLFFYNYVQDRAYVETVQVSSDPIPDMKVRAPFTVSAAQVRPNLGDLPGDIQDTTYVPQDETFSTLVERRGMFAGYQTLLEQKIAATGRNTPSTCDFDAAADARLGGWWGHSLERQINTTQRWVNWSYDDAYGWCDPKGTPYVVVPLVEQEGVLVVTEKPAGVALYNGDTGQVEIRPNGDGIPGPTYPASLAETQRAANTAINGFGDWFWNRAGWELPDEIDSINSGNQAEFVLADTNGGEHYVTPLSGRGSATALSAFSVADATLRGPDLQPVVVHRLGGEHPVWLSATAITDRIRANFGDVFAQQRDANIFELVPTSADSWVATIGTPQNLLYRVTGRGDLSQDPCLTALDGRQLRCGGTGNIGVSTGGQGTAPTAPAAPDSDLASLSPQQLADLNRRIGEELARRAGS